MNIQVRTEQVLHTARLQFELNREIELEERLRLLKSIGLLSLKRALRIVRMIARGKAFDTGLALRARIRAWLTFGTSWFTTLVHWYRGGKKHAVRLGESVLLLIEDGRLVGHAVLREHFVFRR